MNIADVMAELSYALDTVPGLRTSPYWNNQINPPVAVVGLPDPYDFDKTYGRGSDTATFPVVVIVRNVNARASTLLLGEYCNGSGPKSIKQAIEQYEYEAVDSVRVVSVNFEPVTVAAIDYMAATFDVEVIGRGSV